VLAWSPWAEEYRMRKLFSVALAVFGMGSSALAQDPGETVDLELFRPYPDAYGYMHSPSAATLGHLQIGGGLFVNYANDPLILVYEDERFPPPTAVVSGDNGEGVIDDRVTANVQVGVGLSRYFSLTLDTPLILWQDGYQLTNIDNPDEPPAQLISAAVGDMRLQPKLVAMDRDRLPIGLAIQVPIGFPTGNGGSFLGEEGYTLTPTMVMEFSDRPIRSRQYVFRAAVHAGYHVRPSDTLGELEVQNAAIYGIAFGLHPTKLLELTGEFHGAVWGPVASQQPAEALGGLKFLVGDYVNINLGGGMGVLPGAGAPDWRMLAGVSLAPSFDPNSRDSDKDGIVNALDRCVKKPEDKDGWQDDDGCPELDNDKDGLNDDVDQCPNEAEDLDEYQDQDGCPDVDNDKDNIMDIADRCPNQPETANGYKDEDGCPDDAPVDDTDGDGYKDDVDRCPYDAEDFDGVEDEDGCPDKRVIVENDFIRITERIYFDTGKSTIQDRSISLIDEIASTLVDNPHLTKIRIEGHTDSVGRETSNLKLSQGRANSVVAALVSRKVEKSRLDAVGFGEIRPIETNKTDEGRQANRRVEFIIVEQSRSSPVEDAK
jgi:outer membrane protein OmpA-like peptidoglycan-associated protein